MNQLLTITEVSKLLNLSEGAVRQRLHRGQLQAIRLPKSNTVRFQHDYIKGILQNKLK